jgi:hypothetical protein
MAVWHCGGLHSGRLWPYDKQQKLSRGKRKHTSFFPRASVMGKKQKLSSVVLHDDGVEMFRGKTRVNLIF